MLEHLVNIDSDIWIGIKELINEMFAVIGYGVPSCAGKDYDGCLVGL